ncbi:hypothetical protein [uncultured Tateyamaria sp.]|uniref:hypothetical protein n=1 Tax=Tateyamaria sp. 1078 TaxID=3417464 RepID=UPI0026386B3B|nr:hypothetical protein [uncultured Tateyamaria sp.]
MLTLCLAGPVSAEWAFVETWSDPVDGFETKVAQMINDDGFGLHLYRNPVGRVMALYALPDRIGNLPDEGLVAVVTPQGFAAKDIIAHTEQGRIVEYARSTGRAVRDRLWHGEGQVPVGTLADVLEAPSVALTVTLANGETVETDWSMEGASLPIAQALGLNIEGVAAGAAWEDAASQAMLAAMSACQFPKLDIACVQKVTACSPQISDARDIDGFEVCVAKGE